jgi:hypothetical protein
MSVLSVRTAGVLACALALAAGCSKKQEGASKADAAAASASASAVSTAPAPARTTETTPSNGTPELQKACYSLAKARCTKLMNCAKATFDLHDGPFMACLSRNTLECRYERGSKETGRTPEAIEKCAKAQGAASCADAIADRLPECERAPGTIADGKACTFDAQCTSQLCIRNLNETCGTCEAAPKEGDACKQDRCGDDALACVDAKCTKRQPKGETCASSGGCQGSLVCFNGKCSEPGKAGTKCDPANKTTAACDVTEALYCDKASSTCKAYTIANAGEACGDKAPGKHCGADATCEDDKCQALLKLGAACQGTGAMCDHPAECIEGVCKVPDIAKCVN